MSLDHFVYFMICCLLQDFGYPQVTSTEALKACVLHNPVEVAAETTSPKLSGAVSWVAPCCSLRQSCLYMFKPWTWMFVHVYCVVILGCNFQGQMIGVVVCCQIVQSHELLFSNYTHLVPHCSEFP